MHSNSEFIELPKTEALVMIAACREHHIYASALVPLAECPASNLPELISLYSRMLLRQFNIEAEKVGCKHDIIVECAAPILTK